MESQDFLSVMIRLSTIENRYAFLITLEHWFVSSNTRVVRNNFTLALCGTCDSDLCIFGYFDQKLTLLTGDLYKLPGFPDHVSRALMLPFDSKMADEQGKLSNCGGNRGFLAQLSARGSSA